MSDAPSAMLRAKSDWPTLSHDTETVLAGQPFAEREVTTLDSKRSYLKRIFPYLNAAGKIDGIVVTLIDITERKRNEAEVLESKLKLEAALASMNDAVFISDVEGRFIDFNDAFATFHKFRNKDECAKTFAEYPEILDVFMSNGEPAPVEQWAVPRALRGETAANAEYILRRKDTGEMWVGSYSFAPIRDKDGVIIGSVVAGRDITEKRRTEEALQESEEQFRTLSNAIPQLCWMANADGWIFWYNQRWYEYTGTTPEQMEGWGWQSVHDPTVLPQVLEQWQASIATRKPFDMVFPLRGADGVFRPFLTRILPVHDRDGKVVRWFGTNTDITEQLNTEQILRQGNERLDLLADTAGRLLASDSPQKVVDSLCQKVMALLDCQAFFNFLVDETEGRLHLNACAGIPEEEKKKIEWLDYGVAVCGCAAREACRIVAEDISNAPDPRTELVKSYGIQAYACHPLIAQGRVLGTLSFGTRTRTRFSDDDIALMKAVADHVAIAMERKRSEVALKNAHNELEIRVRERTEELREKDQLLLQQSRQAAMGEMIGNIAHQWRQPLNTLSLTIGMLPVMQETGKLTPENLKPLEESAMGIIQHMSQTINDFSNYFKPDKEKVPFQVSEAVSRTMTLIRDSFANREIAIEVMSVDNPVIDGYPNEFSQVLLNILLNARDALLERKIRDPKVKICLDIEHDKAVVTVNDNAGGIPEDIIEKIFDPYFTTKGPEHGTGVGLFMSKGIIEKNMGGRLTVRNTDKGAEFRIEV